MMHAPDYEAAVNASPYHYIFLAPDLTIIGVNDTYLKTARTTREQLIGRNIFEAFPPDPEDPEGERRFRRSFERVLATGEPDTISLVRYAIPDPEGDGFGMVERYWSVIHTPLLDASGAVYCLMQTPIDITALHETKKALHSAESVCDTGFRMEGNLLSRSKALEHANRMLDEELNHLRSLFEQAPGFMAVVRGPDFVFELANEAYCKLIGNHDLIGKPFRDVFPGNDGEHYIRIMERVLRTGEAFVGHDLKLVIRRHKARAPMDVYFDLVVQPVMAPDGTVRSLFVQGQDITPQKRALDDLRISNERLKLAIEGTGDGMWDWDVQADEVTYSKRWKEILGYADHEIGTSPDEWRSRLHPEDEADVLAALHDCIIGKTQAFSTERRMRCKDGSWKWTLSRGIVVGRDEKGRPLRITGMMTDITEKKASDERIWQHANFDTLTGLPNRRLFRDRLDHEVRKAHRTGLQTALFFIDLDRFKETNDLLGHDAGDMLLMQAAQRLRACVRESDTVARLGGDEFTVILAELDGVAHVEYIAQKILATLAEPFRLGNEVVYVSGSIGITLYPADAGGPEELIRNADQAMYAAKNAGRNQFSYFTRTMQEQAHYRLRLGGDLRSALHTGQLKVYYQPVIDLGTGHIVKAEALLRWDHPGLGPVEPAKFISLAEESGLINEIGDWVFRQAADCVQRWSAKLGKPFQISVNASPLQFMSQASDTSWNTHLRTLGLPGSAISIEITEGMLLNASPLVSGKLLEYRDAGIQVAIDDFGTGHSSLAYLKKFDIDYLKIDQSFVQDMATDDSDRAIAESMIVMAHRLGMKVIAEGIETEEQCALLRAAGCDYGQGFWYARAAPPEEFERMLTRDYGMAQQSMH
ncbi:MAG TPA: EAL domain-containing protein [Noviherbaspirillum sp.]